MADPIEENFMKRGDLFGLEFHEGYAFFSIESWGFNQYRPYTGLDKIGPQSGSGFVRLEDDTGDDITYVPPNTDKVLHVSIGQRPASLRRYTYYPENSNLLHQIPNLTSPSARGGDDYGYVDGNNTPYEDPTDAEELLIPPGVHLNHVLYNPNQNKTVRPVLNIKMREYKITHLDPNKDKNQVKRIVSPGSPAPIYPVGTIGSQENVGATKWDVELASRDDVVDIRRN